MQTKSSLSHFLVSLAFASSASAQVEDDALTAVLLDDQTGVELARDHGIQSIAMTDFVPFIDKVISGKGKVTINHLPIDDDAKDNQPTSLAFQAYSGPQPPKRVEQNVPFRVLQKKMAQYQKDRATWQNGILGYRKGVATEVTTFLRQVAISQQEISERFDRILMERNGRDFNRSDIVGAISQANELLKDKPQPFLILNSDCLDRPGKRTPSIKPLNVEQLDPKITLIFVNTSLLPQKQPIFQGLKNPILHAKSMKEAMELLGGKISKD